MDEVTKNQLQFANLNNCDLNKPFYYGFELDQNNLPKIGTGTKTNPLRKAFTSIVLLVYTIRGLQFNNLVWHIDCTYKLNYNRFPLMTTGVGDLSGHLHPIYFALVSQETEEDFVWLFQPLISLCSLFYIDFSKIPLVVMMDACGASYNAVKNGFIWI